MLASFCTPHRTATKPAGISHPSEPPSLPPEQTAGSEDTSYVQRPYKVLFLGGTRFKTYALSSTSRAQVETFPCPARKAARTVLTERQSRALDNSSSSQAVMICAAHLHNPPWNPSLPVRRGEEGGEPAAQWFILPRNRGPSLEYCDTW